MATKLLPRNEHNVDRVLRIIVGLALLPLAFIGPQTPWAWLALVPLVTGALGSCPIYTLLGVSTCPIQKRSGAATQH